MEGFGYHFVFDGVIKDIDSMFNIDKVRDFLDKCPDEIGMTKITIPQVYEIGGKVMGFVIIAESHLAFHGDLYSGKISIDIFSCMPFSCNDTLLFIKKCFPCRMAVTNYLDRGLEFPKT